MYISLSLLFLHVKCAINKLKLKLKLNANNNNIDMAIEINYTTHRGKDAQYTNEWAHTN